MLYEYADPGAVLQFSAHTPSTSADGPWIRLFGAAHFDAGTDYIVRRDTLPQLLFAYTLAGEGRLRYGERDYPQRRGSVILIDCNQYHEYGTAGSHWDFVWFHFDGSLAAEYCRRIWARRGPSFEAGGQCVGIWQLIFELSQREGDVAEAGISAEIYRLLTVLYTSLPRDPCIERAVELIERRATEPITIADMAKEACLSPYYFQRLFRQQTGQTPHEYLCRRRITLAQQRLIFTDDSIACIAEETGFCSSSHFTSVFRRLTGCYPTEYRSNLSLS